MRHVGNDMSMSPLITAEERTPLLEAWRRMKEARVRHLPVLDRQKKVVGMISDRDLWRAADSNLSHCKVFADLSVAFDADAIVKDYMSSPVKSAYANEDLASVVRTMIEEKISALVVLDAVENTLVGIVTTEDLMKVLFQLLKQEPNSYSGTGVRAEL